jgi:hypothetical protein
MPTKWGVEFFNSLNSHISAVTFTMYTTIIAIFCVLTVIPKSVIINVLLRITVAEMSGRNWNWSRGQMPNQSQSFHNLTAGNETGLEPRLHLSQSISASHKAIRASSEEEGLELLGSTANGAISNFEEVDASLLDYDSDTQDSEQTVVQTQASAAMDTDSGGQHQESTEMDATYFQCRAARLPSHKDLLISVPRDDSFGRTVTVPSAAIGSFKNHSNIASTFMAQELCVAI